MISQPKPKDTKDPTFLERVDELQQHFRLNEYGGAFLMNVPARHIVSDRRYLTDGNVAESYRIFSLLLQRVPFLIQTVTRYVESYKNDLILVNSPGLPQPKIVVDNYEDLSLETKAYIFTSADKYRVGDKSLTKEEIELKNTFRKEDYIHIICILWLINLIRSNPPIYEKLGIFKKKLVPREDKTIHEYKSIRRQLIDAYGKESALIIIKTIFNLLEITPTEFFSEALEP